MWASPEYTPLDDVDRTILQLLQRDACHVSAVEIAEKVGVSDSTVRNRIADLEDRGIIEGYAPVINYEQAGYQLQIRFLVPRPSSTANNSPRTHSGSRGSSKPTRS